MSVVKHVTELLNGMSIRNELLVRVAVAMLLLGHVKLCLHFGRCAEELVLILKHI